MSSPYEMKKCEETVKCKLHHLCKKLWFWTILLRYTI